jgi:mono/diheme cytochrome c family protein
MLRAIILCTAVLGAALLISGNISKNRATAPTAAAKGDVERGKYLVEEVARCPECHTPRDDNGGLKSAAWLRGASIWIQPVQHIANWADSAPPLAGLPSLSDTQMETVLEKGTGPQGETLRPPMHTYHLHPADAKAIIAYLKSMPRGPSER